MEACNKGVVRRMGGLKEFNHVCAEKSKRGVVVEGESSSALLSRLSFQN